MTLTERRVFLPMDTLVTIAPGVALCVPTERTIRILEGDEGAEPLMIYVLANEAETRELAEGSSILR